MKKKQLKTAEACLVGSIHHYQQIAENAISQHTLGQIGIPYAQPPARPVRFICIQCGNVITVK